MRDKDSDTATDTAVPPDDEAIGAELVGRAKQDRSPRRFPSSRVTGTAERDRMFNEARNVEFPIGLRGYERAAVQRYVERVNRLIAELEMSSSPESAVRHALDEVSEETRGILQRAQQTADEITARSRAKADDRLQEAELGAREMLEAAQQQAKEAREVAQHEAQAIREAAQHEAQELRDITSGEAQKVREMAQREAAELRETTIGEMAELREKRVGEAERLRAAAQHEADEMRAGARREADELLARAETRALELARSAEAIWRERRRLIDDIRAVGEQLVAIGELEGKRFPRLAEELPLGDERTREPTSGTVSEPVAPPQKADKG